MTTQTERAYIARNRITEDMIDPPGKVVAERLLADVFVDEDLFGDAERPVEHPSYSISRKRKPQRKCSNSREREA